MHLPPFKHRAAAASPLQTVVSPPLVPPSATNVPSPACTLLVVLTLLHQLAPCSRTVPSGRSVAARGHRRHLARTSLASTVPPPSTRDAAVHAWSLSRLRVLPRLLRASPPHLHRKPAWPLQAIIGPADYPFASLGIQDGHSWSLLVRRLLRPTRLHRQRHCLVLDYTCSFTPAIVDCIGTLCRCAPRNHRGGLLC
jgi:hypothetical protein